MSQIEKQQISTIALYSFITALPISAGATLIAQGNTALWASLQQTLGLEEARAQISYEGDDGWTNSQGASMSINVPPPPPPPPVGDGDGDGDSGG